MRKMFVFPSPHYDAGNGPGSSPTPAPVLTPSERLARAKELIAGLEQLGIDEFNDIVASGKEKLVAVEEKVKAEAAVLEADAAAVIEKLPSLAEIEDLFKTELAKFQAFEKTFCEQHALSIQAVNTWIAVIGGIVLLKLLKVI